MRNLLGVVDRDKAFLSHVPHQSGSWIGFRWLEDVETFITATIRDPIRRRRVRLGHPGEAGMSEVEPTAVAISTNGETWPPRRFSTKTSDRDD